MTLEEFAKKYCFACGSQRCTGPQSEFADGCKYYRELIKNDPMEDLFKKYTQDKYDALQKIIKKMENVFYEI